MYNARMPNSFAHIEISEEGCTPLRGVGFLVSENKKADAYTQYKKLRENERTQLLHRIRCWMDEIKNDKHYHGWNKSEFGGAYTKCFVFKLRENRHRFYGLLHHPCPKSGRFQACTLICHTNKYQKKTEKKHLDTCIQYLCTIYGLDWEGCP